MPPILFFCLSFPVTRLAHALFPTALANGAISGAFVFCKVLPILLCVTHLAHVDVIYDSMHYAYATFFLHVYVFLTPINHSSMHHTKLPAYLREQKKYHLAHHYKNFELGFGVTSMPLCLLLRIV